jgi:hypothetical protein
MVMKTNKEAGLLRAGGSICAITAGVEGVQPAVRSLRGVCDMHQSLFVTKADGMQCGHDGCRHWWASQGRYLWCGDQCDSPVPCVFSCTSVVPLPLSWCLPNFVPLQPAITHLKKLNPDKRKITHEHVLKSLGDKGRILDGVQVTAKIAEFQVEALQVIQWGAMEVRKRMLIAAARLDLKFDGKPVDSFEELKKSWEHDRGEMTTKNFYEICHGDYEGKKNQHWSREWEMKCMRDKNIACDTEPKLREKGGYEQCITCAKGNVVRLIMARSNKTHQGKTVLSLKSSKVLTELPQQKKKEKPERRKQGEFFFKKNVSGRSGRKRQDPTHESH